MRKQFALYVLVLVSLFAASRADGQAQINGTPLRIQIERDTSFQVYNSTVSATLGQIFPQSCNRAASGIFASIGGVLYRPNLAVNAPCKSFFNFGGTQAAWTEVSSTPAGTGTAADPFRVTVVVDAGTTGVRLSATYSYVNGENFFRIAKTFTATNATGFNTYLGADISLAGSDSGIPFLEPTSSSPGGEACPQGSYTILLIPTTPADSWTAELYSNVWVQIRNQGALTYTPTTATCPGIDNGAALHWARTLAAGGSVTIHSAVSFGAIPPIATFNVTSVTPPQGTQGQTLTVVVNGIGFQNGTTFNFGPGITVTSTTIDSTTQATLTIVISSTAAIGPRDVIGTQAPGGATATLDDGFTVIGAPPPPSCTRILASQVRCEVGPNGLPTGRYVWTYRVLNLSGMPLHHLYVTDLPAGVTVGPSDHVVFNPAVTGISPPITMIFSGASPGTLSFTLSLHDENLEECCSLPVVLTIPPCDCAQTLTESTPACVNFPFSIPPPYKYKVTLQNLSPIVVENVLIAAVSPTDLVTPIATSALTVTPSAIGVPASGPGSSINVPTISLSGPLAVPGANICLRIGLHADDLDDCCSIVRCFTLPNCSFRDDDDFTTLGNGRFTRFGSGFTLTGIGSSGGDGIAIDLHGARSADLAFAPLEAAGPLPNGAFFELGAAGNPGELSGRLRVTKQDGAYQIAPTIGDARNYRVEVFNGGERVGTVTRQGITDVLVIWPVAAGVEIVDSPTSKGVETLAFTLATDRPVPWRLANGSTLTGDRYRITPTDATAGTVSLQTLELRAANIPSITVTGVAIVHDCNGNGVPDGEDIANGTSLDRDFDDIPDECEAGDLDVSLDTGYDQTTGAQLPLGSDDDDWTIVSPAPQRAANVVALPHVNWGAAFPGTRWLSIDATRGSSIPGTSLLAFERCFCIAEGAIAVALDLQVKADNEASVLLNGQRLGGPAGAFSGAPLVVRRTGTAGDGLFVAGRNCVRVEVSDFGGFTAFAAAGRVTATGGACPTP